MTKLECSVTNCLHNTDNCCCKHAIVVDGCDAKEAYETCCGSFRERGEKSGKKKSFLRKILLGRRFGREKTPESPRAGDPGVNILSGTRNGEISVFGTLTRRVRP